MASIYETNIFQEFKGGFFFFLVTQLVHVPLVVPLHYLNHIYTKLH